QAPLLQVLRQIGSAFPEVAKPRSYVYGYYFNQVNVYHEHMMSFMKAEHVPRANAMNVDASTTPILEQADNVGAYLGRQFLEWHGRQCPPDRLWYSEGTSTCKYALPANRGSLLDYAVILSRCTPVYISHCWVDGNIPQGHDDQYREFAAAYRTIPLGKYKTVFAQEYPGVTVRSATVGRKTYFYAVNTDAKPRSVTVKAKKEIRERTIGHPAPIRKDGGWRIGLEPYAVRVFELPKGRLSEITAE
ncbi:MAG: hypothetical protein PHR35_19215, partial [Kiritimatiellae bacterium]|nr:hypothetical protein [Kiritimatiellia bacterium]